MEELANSGVVNRHDAGDFSDRHDELGSDSNGTLSCDAFVPLPRFSVVLGRAAAGTQSGNWITSGSLVRRHPQ